MTTRIHVLSLSDYNEGRLIGAWIDTEDQTSDTLYETIQTEVLNKSRSIVAEEWIIADHEGYPFDASQLSLETIEAIEVACNISDNREAMLAFLSCFPEYRQSCHCWRSVTDAFEARYQGEHDNDEMFTEDYVHGVGLLSDASDLLSRYFDWDKFERDLMFDYCSENNHYFYSN